MTSALATILIAIMANTAIILLCYHLLNKNLTIASIQIADLLANIDENILEIDEQLSTITKEVVPPTDN